MTFRPTLAWSVEEKQLPDLPFPVAVSPKYDGVRALVKGGYVLSRTLKPIPNQLIQCLFGSPQFEGFDGELMLFDPITEAPLPLHEISGAVRRVSADKPFTFMVFDWAHPDGLTWQHRQRYLSHAFTDIYTSSFQPVPQTICYTPEQILLQEEEALELGFEGVVIRKITGLYKHGRSTLREANFLRLKRTTDVEAQIVGFVEATANLNEAETDERGYTKRSTHAEWKVPSGTLGAFLVNYAGTTQAIPPGAFSAAERKHIWLNQKLYLFKWLKFRHFPYGAKDNLRHARALAFRDTFDMGAPHAV